MAILNNDEIRDTYNYLATIENILRKEVKIIEGNKSHLDKIVPESIVRVYSVKEKQAQYFTTNLSKIYYETSVVSLVAIFEKIIFAKYKTSYGTIKGIVITNAQRPLDFFKSREKFVNGNIDKLHSIIELIDGHIDAELLSKLKKIKEQRDYLAHGKRFGEAPAVNMKLELVAEILDKVITEIER